MPLIEVGGVKRGCKLTDIPSCQTVSALKLPNPFPLVRSGKIKGDPASIAAWLAGPDQKNAVKEELARLVAEGEAVLRSGKDLRVQCLYGRHRSRAVALILSRLVGGCEIAHVDN